MEGRIFFGEHTRYKNFLCSDLEAEPGVQIGKLQAELAQNGHGFLPSHNEAINLTQLRFKRSVNLRADIWNPTSPFAGGIIRGSKREHAGISPPIRSPAQVAAGLFSQAAKLGMEKLTPSLIFLGTKLKVKQRKGG